MSRVRVTHTFDLKDEHGDDANRTEIMNVVDAMTVQVAEPVVGYGSDDYWSEREGDIEGIIKVDVIPLDSTRDPVDVALEQFWSTIADLYPSVTTSDLDPGTRVRFDREAEAAVRTWLRYNNPQVSATANPFPADPQ